MTALMTEAKMTKRQREVLTMVMRGKTNKQIANDLGLSVRTVEDHRRNAFQSTDTRNALELIYKVNHLFGAVCPCCGRGD